MATHRIWKLKFNISKAGLAFRWGDGEIQRFPFGLKSGEGVDVAEGMDAENGGYPDDGADDEYGRYDDGYAAEDSYAGEGDYEEGDYEEGDYEEGDYEEGDYDRGEYEEGYYDENGEYIEGIEGEEEQSPFMQYVDRNDWVTYALLVLLPPLGIYLLWRRGKFDTLIRAGVSAVSALWFIAILTWIIIGAFNTRGVTDVGGGMKLFTVSPTPFVSVTPSPTPASTFGSLGTIGPLEGTPAATPITGVTPGPNETAGTGYVYSPATGMYYHAVKDCANIPSGVSTSYVVLKTAENRSQSPCPLCFNAKTYYATADGRYYHAKADCSGMKNAQPYTEQAAKLEGKTACPVCLNGPSRSQSNTVPANYYNRLSKDASGIKVWATKGGRYFHTVSNCSNMKGASNITLLTALKAGKSACPTCASAAGRTVYATETGKYYHAKSTCSGMRGAKALPVAAAMVMGKDSCPVCIGPVKIPSNLQSPGTSESSEDGVYVYATSNGRYYHTDDNCQGMTGADKVLLKTMLAAGRPACPVCAKDADRRVYATKDGRYYHSFATCSDMTGATAGPLAQALAYGYKKCPKCWTSGSGNTPGGTESASGVSVYRTANGKYYHTNQTCSGMSGATKATLETAVAEGKTPCPVCASVASKTVYATAGGKYYHYNKTCSGMTNAKAGTLADALMSGFAACPVCVKTSAGGPETPGGSNVEYTPGKSGIKVYASQAGKYYHLTKSCGGSETSYITLETALNYGKDPCPICAKKVAGRTVYAAAGDQYFHATAEHAGSGAKAGTAASALAFGLKVCPVCKAAAEGNVDLPESSNTFNPGESGIKVYAAVDGKYFHSSKQHAGSGASHVTLETAINYGKKPCPDCASTAYKTVYATMDSKYYHYSKSCAGSEASSGYLAIALAMGKDPCPVCVKGSGGSSGGGSSGGGSGGVSTVYIDLDGDSNPSLFHRASSCSKSGMSGGDPVTVDFVQDQGFNPCPYCW